MVLALSEERLMHCVSRSFFVAIRYIFIIHPLFSAENAVYKTKNPLQSECSGSGSVILTRLAFYEVGFPVPGIIQVS
jgi:hypothetical protein